MKPLGILVSGVFAGLLLIANSQSSDSDDGVGPDYFEGRWAFAEEACDQPTNWTLLAGGNFVSEDLTGTWQWYGGQLTLNLIDLAVDEETEEEGSRFQMEGPVSISGPDQFILKIEPDDYVMKRCK
ncbi:hypothetical protein [Parasphingorhabdus cellanae]|uniref:Uncharacterized protein n=1 Tax=Parasphingorhabdus cellanae TaxID=2806553 RepID=A0ABX7T685_9SPHN|nr:hypothetical protein [Parasphingorhabdus cellanae]QTD56636.1 hypothetical protein J4G78_03330 [Parasphingorhabdus cellanae]